MHSQIKRISHYICITLVVVFCTLQGCVNPFIALEDYQRDIILFGGLAAALLFSQGPSADDGPAGAPLPGQDGLHCWDLNANGIADSEEDVNGDNIVNVHDCRGAEGLAGTDSTQEQEGTQGPAGPPGPQGTPGPEFFNIFIDDFFTNRELGEFPVVPVPIDVPVLGILGTVAGEIGSSAAAFRAAIPNTFNSNNDLTLSLFVYRTGPYFGNCLVLQIDAVRLRDGSGIEQYGSSRWISLDVDDLIINSGEVAGLQTDEVFMVIDLPINTSAGLGYPPLNPREFVAFEIRTTEVDGGSYQLLGAELFESAPNSSATSGASIFQSPEEVECSFVDCNETNLPDVMDIQIGESFDCNNDGIPDECASCPPLDVVFVMDTSGSMGNEGAALCDVIDSVINKLGQRGIVVRHDILAIAPHELKDLPPCVVSLSQSVSAKLGNTVPGNNGSCPSDLTGVGSPEASERDENWAPATAVVAEHYSWTPGAIRMVVPISDEGPCLGGQCDDPEPDSDTDAILNAIAVANQYNVIVSPIVADFPEDCIIPLAQQLAIATGGSAFLSTDPGADLAGAITSIVDEVCRRATDCNGNEIPDECEICTIQEPNSGCFADCNSNGVLDMCEICSGKGPQFGCLPDCNGNGIPDECNDDCDD